MHFQFPQPESITAGKVTGKANKYFIAQVASKLFCYESKGFEADGWINKMVTILDKPKDFKRFREEGGLIKYETVKGDLKSVFATAQKRIDLGSPPSTLMAASKQVVLAARRQGPDGIH